jgi:hypothetical protein
LQASLICLRGSSCNCRKELPLMQCHFSKCAF